MQDREELDTVKSSLEEQLSRVKTLEDSNAILTGTVEELKEELEEEQNASESLKEQMKEYWNTTEGLREQLSEKAITVEELKEQLEEEQATVLDLRETVRTKELEVDEVVEREQQLQEELTLTSKKASPF